MIRRIKLRAISEAVFPFYIPIGLIQNYFEFVTHNYDFCLLPIINDRAQTEKHSKGYWDQYRSAQGRYAVINTLDEYRNNSAFSQQSVEVARDCDFVFGYQLPVRENHQGFRPIFYPTLLESTLDVRMHPVAEEVDICFWGAYSPELPSQNMVGSMRSERYHRASVISQLASLSAPALITDFKLIHYWRLSKELQPLARWHYKQALARSRLCLSLYGYGYNTFRNADIFALERPLLSPPVHRHVHVPDHALWESQKIGFFFEEDGSDIDKVVYSALSNPDERRRRARQGRVYYEQYCTPKGIIETIFYALSASL